MHEKRKKPYIKVEMYDEIRELFESGEIDRLLRLNGVRRRDWDDFKQEVALILLSTPPQKIHDLTKFTMGVIKRQYHSRKSSWYINFRAWDEYRTGLADAYAEISGEGRPGDMVSGFGQSEGDVQGFEKAGCVRADDFLAGGGTWYNSRSGKKAKMPQEHSDEGI